MALIISFFENRCETDNYPLVAVQQLQLLDKNPQRFALSLQLLESELRLLRDSVTLHIHMNNECAVRQEILGKLSVQETNYRRLSNELLERRSWQTIAASARLDALYNFEYALKKFSSYFKNNKFPNVKTKQVKEAVDAFSARFSGDLLARNAVAHRASRLHGDKGKNYIPKEKIARIANRAKSRTNFTDTYLFDYEGSVVENDLSWSAFKDAYQIYLKAITSLPLNINFADFPSAFLLQYLEPEDLRPKPLTQPPATPPPSADPR